jgi:hypothetical protein
VIGPPSSGPIRVQHTHPPRYGGFDPIINTQNSAIIFLKSAKQSVANFDPICSLVREEFDDYTLLDFRFYPMISIFGRPDDANALLRETQGRCAESGNGMQVIWIQRYRLHRGSRNQASQGDEYRCFSDTLHLRNALN